MRPIRVDHVITRLILGGAQENTVLSCEGLHALGRYDVRLLTGPALGPEGELLDRARTGGYRVSVLPALRRDINPPLDLAALLHLWILFLLRPPSIVHTHSSKAGILGRAAARLAGVRAVVHTIHGLPFHEHQSALENGVYRLLEQVCAGISDGIICVGQEMKRKALAARVSRPERYEVVYSGMEVDRFEPGESSVRERLGFGPGDIVLGVVSRLAPLKGHSTLIDAVKRLLPAHPRLKILFVGDGRLRPLLEREGEGLVTFAGLVPPDEIPDHIRAMDLLVHPSLREGLPRAAVQGLLCGRPVIAADCDGAREVVIEGQTGFLVPPEAPEALAAAIARVLALPDRGRSLALAGRERFLPAFDAWTMVGRLDSIYRRLLHEEGAPRPGGPGKVRPAGPIGGSANGPVL